MTKRHWDEASSIALEGRPNDETSLGRSVLTSSGARRDEANRPKRAGRRERLLDGGVSRGIGCEPAVCEQAQTTRAMVEVIRDSWLMAVMAAAVAAVAVAERARGQWRRHGIWCTVETPTGTSSPRPLYFMIYIQIIACAMLA